jgi:Restriction Enzyme Adenine Methylase Associated
VPEATATPLELDRALGTVRDRVAKYQRQGIGEQDTKAALIVPVLRALGWDVEDLEDVKLEYRRRPNDNPVDYALFLLRTPRLFIEAKSLGAHLDDGKWASQILAYATVAGVEWVALTDGNEWRIYNSHAPVPVEQKLFRIVHVADPQSNVAETLRLLAKAQMADHLIDAFWKSDFVDRQIRDALGRLFGPEPDPALIRFIRAKATGLSPAEVRASLGRLRTTFDFPVVAPPVFALADVAPERKPLGRPTSPPRQASAKSVGAGTPWRLVTLDQLIDGGLVRIPFAIEHRYRGVELAARIEAARRIVFNGQEFDSLSTAGGVARKSVAGSFPGRDIPQTNGWTFWQFRGSDGRLLELDDLRRELYQRKVITLPSDRRSG